MKPKGDITTVSLSDVAPGRRMTKSAKRRRLKYLKHNVEVFQRNTAFEAKVSAIRRPSIWKVIKALIRNLIP